MPEGSFPWITGCGRSDGEYRWVMDYGVPGWSAAIDVSETSSAEQADAI